MDDYSKDLKARTRLAEFEERILRFVEARAEPIASIHDPRKMGAVSRPQPPACRRISVSGLASESRLTALESTGTTCWTSYLTSLIINLLTRRQFMRSQRSRPGPVARGPLISTRPRGFLVGQTTRGTRRRFGRGYRPHSYAVPEHTQIRKDPF
jgi:hypothetical protein